MAQYRGYEVFRAPRTRKWGAYNGSPTPWFEGKTAQEVRDQIDAALAECPEDISV